MSLPWNRKNSTIGTLAPRMTLFPYPFVTAPGRNPTVMQVVAASLGTRARGTRKLIRAPPTAPVDSDVTSDICP